MTDKVYVPSVENSEIVFEGFGKIRRDRLRLENNSTYDYYTFDTVKAAVVIIARTPEKNIVVNREYRHPTQQVLLSLPGGLLSKGEGIIEGALRELEEETGFVGNEAKILGEAYPFPGISPTLIHYVLVEDCRPLSEPDLEPSEFLVTEVLSPQSIRQAIQSGTPADGSLCTGLWFLD